jgi:hypothetical protein
MKKNNVFMLIALFATLTGYGKNLSISDSIEQKKIPEGTWKLDSIVQKQGEKKTTELLPKKIIPKDIYYSCPVKIVFEKQECQFMYENEKTKEMKFNVYESYDSYSIQNSTRLFCGLPNEEPVNEWVFDYLLTVTHGRLILSMEHREESSDTKIIYEYFYSLISQIKNNEH